MHIENGARVSSWKYKRSFGCRDGHKRTLALFVVRKVQRYKSHELGGACALRGFVYRLLCVKIQGIYFPCFHRYRNHRGGDEVARGTVLLDLMRTCFQGSSSLSA